MLLSDICLSVTYIGHKSRTERPKKTKIGTEVAHVTRDSDTTFKVKGQGHQATLLTAALTHEAGAAVTMRTHWAWETTAMSCLLGGAQGTGVPTEGGEGREHIMSPRTQLVIDCYGNKIWKTLLTDSFFNYYFITVISALPSNSFHFHISLTSPSRFHNISFHPSRSLVTGVSISTAVLQHLFPSLRDSPRIHRVHIVTSLFSCLLEASFCAPRGPMRAIYEDRIWQMQFPSCCTQNMELFTATSPFADHQPTTVPVWAQNSSLQTRLHMTFTSENYWGVNLLTFYLHLVVTL